MAGDILLRSDKGPVATLVLNRPKHLNAFNRELRLALIAAVRAIDADPAIRVAILKGEGRSFCAGADLTEGLAGGVAAMLEAEYKPFLTGIAASRVIWIAQVQGAAAGIGAATAMACDLVAMADDAYVYMAFAAIGLIPDGGNTWLLGNAMGYRHALAAILEGRKIPAGECVGYGIANRTFAPDALDAGVAQWAGNLANGAPLAMTAAKKLLRENHRRSFAEAIDAEARAQNPLTRSADFRNAVKAFFGKRKPEFSGR
jgi:2-(1,2-epoxy-1,2-dihydrophenyl)acetyl-CoA isomerase